MADRDRDGAPEEALLDKYFDFFKHIGTLDVAVAIVMLAITRTEEYGAIVYISLVSLGISLTVTLLGMQVVLNAHRSPGRDQSAILERLAVLCAAALFGGAFSFVVSALTA